MTVRQRLARIAEAEADRIAGVYLAALEAVDDKGNPDHAARVKAASSFLAEALGKRSQALHVDQGEPEVIIFESAAIPPPEGVERAQRTA
jgi:hypothetical protein